MEDTITLILLLKIQRLLLTTLTSNGNYFFTISNFYYDKDLKAYYYSFEDNAKYVIN